MPLNEIETLRARIATLEAALREAVAVGEAWIHDQLDGTGAFDNAWSELDAARAALAPAPSAAPATKEDK